MEYLWVQLAWALWGSALGLGVWTPSGCQHYHILWSAGTASSALSLLWDSSASFRRWLEWNGLIFLFKNNSAAVGSSLLIMRLAPSHCRHSWLSSLRVVTGWTLELGLWRPPDRSPSFTAEEPDWSETEVLSVFTCLGLALSGKLKQL